MSVEKLKALFGSEEVMLELVETDNGDLVLRNGRGEEGKQLVKIEINPDVREILEDQVHVVAQQMVQVILFNLLEKQLGEFQTQVVDEVPKHFS